MVAWLRRLFRREPPAPEPPPPDPSPLLDLTQRSARAVAKLGLRLDQLESKIEGGFADVRAHLASPRSDAAVPRLPFDLLLDAADLLDEAVRISPSPEYAAGLAGIRDRLERFLTEAGLQRMARIDGAPDPRRFRIVGREGDGSRPRVVRAAVLEGERLVREGEIILEHER